LEWQSKKKEVESCVIEFEEELAQYNQLKVIADNLKQEIHKISLQSKYLAPFFHAGRMFKVGFLLKL
jgi:hypothetical protein